MHFKESLLSGGVLRPWAQSRIPSCLASRASVDKGVHEDISIEQEASPFHKPNTGSEQAFPPFCTVTVATVSSTRAGCASCLQAPMPGTKTAQRMSSSVKHPRSGHVHFTSTGRATQRNKCLEIRTEGLV